MLDHIIDIIRQQFGDHFVGIGIILFCVIGAIRKGVHDIQKWIEVEILEPYLQPTIARINNSEKVQISHTELLIDHEKRIRNNERINQILQGKVLGGVIHLDEEND